MDASEPQFLELGGGADASVGRRTIAYRWSKGAGRAPVQLLWLSGFLSDMASTKAVAVAEWANAAGVAMMRFDYSGHGLSSGTMLEASIGDWLEEAIAAFDLMAEAPRIVIGSSMGGWLALLLARHLAARGRARELAGLVLIAPAWDMTESLMWRAFTDAIREEIESKGVTYLPSAYGDPYPVTRRLIEEGRSHLLEGHAFDPGCPVRILQGMRDADVPYGHALDLLEILKGGDVELTLIKDGDHRQSAPSDLRRLIATIAALVWRTPLASGERVG
jgi:pimeloyl-ACP methyl ester carboxylesterase